MSVHPALDPRTGDNSQSWRGVLNGLHGKFTKNILNVANCWGDLVVSGNLRNFVA